MALTTPRITPTKKIAIRSIGEALPRAHYHRCPECDLIFSLPKMRSHQSAFCPRCRAKIRDGRDWSLTRLAAMAFTMLLLMPFALGEPLLHIYLLGVRIDANVMQGIWQMTRQGDPLTASFVLLRRWRAANSRDLNCLSVVWQYSWDEPAPGAADAGKAQRVGDARYLSCGHWRRVDQSSGLCFLQPGVGLFAFIALVILSILTLSHLNVEQLWDRFYPQRPARRPDEKLRVCLGCHFTGYPDARGRCPRCHIPLRWRRNQSIQKCWAALLASIVLLLPANLLPISVIYVNGGRQEDTILSGIMSLANSNVGVAAIVFIASILVPFTKVIVMFTLLISIHFNCEQGLRTRIKLLRMVTWIGRWSMLDLFVIALTMSLINRDQILAFTMGPAAFYFGAAVILTILAVEWLDSRLLWDAHESGNARFAD